MKMHSLTLGIKKHINPLTMKETTLPFLLHIIALILLLPDTSFADPRTQTVEIVCGTHPEHNATLYVPNFVATMENISSQMRASGFGLSITGSGQDTSYGLAQCYSDLSPIDCVLCYAEARTVLPQCFPSNGGRIFLDGCFMRAENYNFFREYSGPDDRAICGNRSRKGSDFVGLAREALSRISGYRRTEVTRGNESVHVSGDCWRTLDESSCISCLRYASESLLHCLPWSEGRAVNTGCFVRYSDSDFLNMVPGNGSRRGAVIVVASACVSAVGVFVIAGIIVVYLWKQRMIQKKRKGRNDTDKYVKALTEIGLNFKYSMLEKATGSFDESNKLGEGGYGTVYKGVFPDGREIAVKRLFFNNRHRAEDFYNEVKIISNVEHKNLVRLLGCCCSGPESLLVYEYLPNKSLDRFIFDTAKGKDLNWEKRFEIVVGIAEGLVYLHENTEARIIHRDIKASNILLDSRLRAKIADFGLARSFQEDKSHISTAIAGTLGYMAPEYLAHGQLTEKADVYSFGVLLLEIVTGKQNNRSKNSEYLESLVASAWWHFQQKRVQDLFDPKLTLHVHLNVSMKTEILRVVHVGLLCTQENASLRPSMSKALQMLVKRDESLPAPTSPPFMDENTMELNQNSETPSSVANISHSIFHPR